LWVLFTPICHPSHSTLFLLRCQYLINDGPQWQPDLSEIRKSKPCKCKEKGPFPLELNDQLHQNEQFEKTTKKTKNLIDPSGDP
jgi:hypothetical protein